MDKRQKEIGKSLIDALTMCFPGMAPIKPMMQIVLSFIAGDYRSEKDDVVVSIAREITSYFTSIPSGLIENQGAALSAATDLTNIIRVSSLDADFVIECDFDSEILFQRLTQSSREIMATASAQRQGLVSDGLKLLSSRLIERADQIPGIQVAFMRTLLKRLPKA